MVARLDEAHRRMEKAKKCLSNLERRGPGELVENEQLRRDLRRAQCDGKRPKNSGTTRIESDPSNTNGSSY